MRANQLTTALLAGICTLMLSTAIFAQDPPGRHEIRRLDVPGAPDKQIVVELNEFKPGEGLDVIPIQGSSRAMSFRAQWCSSRAKIRSCFRLAHCCRTCPTSSTVASGLSGTRL